VANILQEELKVINLGITQFVQALDAQQATVVHIDWKPTEVNEDIESLLDSLL
jgi:hypothetical protein